MLETQLSIRDVIITIPQDGVILERKLRNGDWLLWDGSAWVESGIHLVFNTGKFLDSDVPNGIYQYRIAPEGTTTYQFSDWVCIGDQRIGRKFGNYNAPAGVWGELLTADDMRYHYLFGISTTGSDGTEFTDAQFQAEIESSIREWERALNITIRKTVFKTDPQPGDVYDKEEDPYYFRRNRGHYPAQGRVNLRTRPIISVERFDLYSNADTRIIDLIPWLRLQKRKGILHYAPRNESFSISGAAYIGYGTFHEQYSDGYRVDYTAGYETSDIAYNELSDLADIIGKTAALKLLNVIGDGLIAGFSSSSLSLDGISESFSSTQSATSAYFGARIQVYLKDIENYYNRNYRKFQSQMIGML